MPFTDSINMVDVIIASKTTLTATPSDVAAGKQFIGTTQHLETGILTAVPARTDVTILAGESYNIPYGINPSPYNVIAKALPDQTPGTATIDDILLTKTAWVNGEKLTGNMYNNGQVTAKIACSEKFQITRGFHDGTGYVEAKSLMEQTFASVQAGEILLGCTAWANGEQLTGTMPNIGKQTLSLNAGEVYAIPAGYHNGAGTVTANTLAAQTVGTATAGEIVEGFTAWVNGVKLTGTITSNAAETIMLPMNGSYNIPNGYHTGLGVVTQSIPSKAGGTFAPTKDEQTIEVAGYYMESDIVISGVDALNYRRESGYVKDSAGNDIHGYVPYVSSNEATVNLQADNWRDNATLNIYHISGTVSDTDLIFYDYDMDITYDWENETPNSYTIGLSTISIDFDSTTGTQVLKFSGVSTCDVTMTERFAAREFGVTE